MAVFKNVCVWAVILFVTTVSSSSVLAQGNEEIGLTIAPPVDEAVVEKPQEEPAVAAPTEAVVQQEQVAPVVAPAEEKPAEWVWGEVTSVDKENNQLTIKHLDYDTYEEIQTVLKTDDKTLLENVSDLGQIQPGDHITVDYKAESGVNIAGLIVVEKKEGQSAATPVAEAPAPSAEAPATATETETPAPVTEVPSLSTDVPSPVAEIPTAVIEEPVTAVTDIGNQTVQ